MSRRVSDMFEAECGSLLPHSFFERDTSEVARDLLGTEIVRKVGSIWLRCRIVETEAYLENGDPAAHCSRGQTPRAKVMWEEPGTIYVYFIYGNYFMLNFVTEPKGCAGAVLIRAVEPVEGLAHMARNRSVDPKRLKAAGGRELWNLTNGPAKLVLAMGIDGSLNGKRLGLPHLAVVEGERPVSRGRIVTTARVGISEGKDMQLRYYEEGNPFVSKG